MSDAWKATYDDVFNVLWGRGILMSSERCKVWLDALDHSIIEDYALSETDPKKQLKLAYSEIERQLIELGVIPAELLD